MPQGSLISDTVRRWTLAVSQLRTRAQRAKRGSTTDPVLADTVTDEALELCNSLLVDLAGAETQISTLRDALQQEDQETMSLFERLPAASVATNAAGLITAGNRYAASLLNVSVRHLAGKPLLNFTQDRVAFLTLLHSLREDGSPCHGTITIRPRERRPTAMDIVVIPRTATNATEWLWFLTPGVRAERRFESASPDVVPCSNSQPSA